MKVIDQIYGRKFLFYIKFNLKLKFVFLELNLINDFLRIYLATKSESYL